MKLLRINQVVNLTRISKTTIYQHMSEGHFPQCIKFGAKATRWLEDDVVAWVEAQRKERLELHISNLNKSRYLINSVFK
ncbi:TPA: AlpA family phage regulatory protein [Vibrio parahaemolyticus]|nr:AlpA family phage regulatory protein [Vibrio parahaemolyticus]HCM1202238.1 AlpA family phage regulatory protein [Vibrio parahaemolyticus]